MINNKLNVELYTLTQAELGEKIKGILKEKGIAFKFIKDKGIWGINHKDKPIFVSHLDTVNRSDAEFKKPLLIKDGKLSRPGYVLGADDRAGVNIMLNHIDDINFVFTYEEERGCIGAKSLALNKTFKEQCTNGTFFVELDRRNGTDLIGATHGYCHKDLSDKLLKVLPNFKDVRGVLTDIDQFTGIMQGVNLSVGYYDAHKNTEYLNIAEFLTVNDLIPDINKIEHKSELPPEKVNVYYGGRYYGNYGNSGSKTCDCCGKKVWHTYKSGDKEYCWDCKSYMEKHTANVKLNQLDRDISAPAETKCFICGEEISKHTVAYHIGENMFGCSTCITPVIPGVVIDEDETADIIDDKAFFNNWY